MIPTDCSVLRFFAPLRSAQSRRPLDVLSPTILPYIRISVRLSTLRVSAVAPVGSEHASPGRIEPVGAVHTSPGRVAPPLHAHTGACIKALSPSLRKRRCEQAFCTGICRATFTDTVQSGLQFAI